jgi:hypothetical protein
LRVGAWSFRCGNEDCHMCRPCRVMLRA